MFRLLSIIALLIPASAFGAGFTGQLRSVSLETSTITATGSVSAVSYSGSSATLTGYVSADAYKINGSTFALSFANGQSSIAIGHNGGVNSLDLAACATTALYNTYIGYSVGGGCQSSNNTVIGARISRGEEDMGDLNTFVGSSAGWRNRGDRNVAVGGNAFNRNSYTSSNTIVGYGAGALTTSGGGNAIFGYGAGSSLATGEKNILIGFGVEAPASDSSNYLNIGGLLVGDMAASSATVLGNMYANSFYGDGTTLTGIATDTELAAVAVDTGTNAANIAALQTQADAIAVSTGTSAADIAALKVSTGALQVQADAIAVSTGALELSKVDRAGGTMTGPLTLSGSSLTVTGKSALWGDVGVGTNTPKTDSLHLWGKDLRLQTDADSGGAVKFMKNGSDSTVNMLYRGGTDFTILKNFTQDYTILQLQSPSGALGTPLESTFALVRGDEPNVEYIDLYNNGYASQTQHGIRIQKRGTGVYRDFVFDQYDGTTYTPLMILKADGKIGVNISTPTSTLDVAGTSASTSTITLSNKTTELFAEDVIGAIDFRTYDSSSGGEKVKGYIRGVAETEYTGGNHRLRLDFGTSRNTDSPSTRMSINGSGNVGIGTISPTALLQVAGGNILISGTGAGIYNTGTSTASAYYGDGSNLSGVIQSTATGNYALRVATATYLATAPGACSAGEFINALTADGTKTCAAPAGGGDVVLAATQTFTGANTFESSTTFSGSVFGISNSSSVMLTDNAGTSQTTFAACVLKSTISITTQGGTRVMVGLSASVTNTNLNETVYTSYKVDNVAYDGDRGLGKYTPTSANFSGIASFTVLTDVLSAGTHWFCPVFRTGGGTATFLYDSVHTNQFWVQELK